VKTKLLNIAFFTLPIGVMVILGSILTLIFNLHTAVAITGGIATLMLSVSLLKNVLNHRLLQRQDEHIHLHNAQIEIMKLMNYRIFNSILLETFFQEFKETASQDSFVQTSAHKDLDRRLPTSKLKVSKIKIFKVSDPSVSYEVPEYDGTVEMFYRHCKTHLSNAQYFGQDANTYMITMLNHAVAENPELSPVSEHLNKSPIPEIKTTVKSDKKNVVTPAYKKQSSKKPQM
jgi:hypothetical protein